MEARTVNNLPPAASHDETVRCLLAIELSKKSWIIAVNTPLSDKISRHRLEGCDWKGLLELIERIRTRVARELNRPVEVISCYEAGYDGFCCIVSSRPMVCATWSLIRRAFKWIGGHDEQRRIRSMRNDCCAH